jgi:hypothetical protein
MHVIGNPPTRKHSQPQIAGYAGEVAVARRAYRRVKDGRTVLGAEDDMNEGTR